MAVIREQRQFKIGTIGVNRPSQAGRIVGEAIADSASRLQDTFYNMAVEEAKRRGAESAQALARQDVIALGEDGRPKAYKIPQLFGKYEREAYNAVLMQRFESEIQLELEGRSKELAIQFRRSPEAYKKAMGDHVAAMANTQESTVYTNYIATLGDGLLQQQYNGLQLQAIQRQEADDRLAYSNSAAQALRDIEDAAAVGLDVSDLIETAKNLDTINVRSGTVLPNAITGNSRERKLAKARGTLRYELGKALESGANKTQLEEALVAIDLGDASLIPDGLMDGVKTMLSAEGFTFNQELSQFGTEILQDGVNQSVVNRNRRMRERQAEMLKTQSEVNSDYFDLLRGTSAEVQAELETIVDKFKTDQQSSIDMISSGFSTEEAELVVSESTMELTSTMDALVTKLYSELNTVEDVTRVQEYLRNPTIANLNAIESDEAHTLAKGLISVSEQLGTRQFVDAALDYAEGITDEKAVLDKVAKSQGAVDARSRLDSEVLGQAFNAKNSTELAEIIARGESIIDGANVSDGDRTRLKGLLNNRASDFHLKLAFNTVTTENAINALKQYARDGDDKSGLLTKAQRELIDTARKYSDDPSNYTTSLNQYADNAQNKRKLKAGLIDDQLFLTNVTRGIGDGTSKTERERLGKLLGVDASYYLDPSFDDPKYAGIEAALQQAAPTIWPQAQVDAINMFLTGKVTDPQQVERVLTLFAKSSEFITKNGDVMRSNGSYSLTSDQYALMSEAAAFAEINNDPQAVLQHIAQIKTAMQDESLTKAKDDYFSRKAKDDVPSSNSVESYVVNNFRETLGNTNLRNRLISIANMHYFANRSDMSDGRFDDLENVLQAEIGKSYVKDDMIVAEDGTNKTLYPLSITTGGQDELFTDYIRAEMKKNSTDPNVNWDEVEFKLIPVGYNEMDRGMTYGVVIVDENGTRQMQEVAYPFADPRETDPVVLPAFFSTNEAGFHRAREVSARGAAMTASPVTIRAEETQKTRDELSMFIEPNKYNSLLSRLPSIEDDYRNLNRGSPQTILDTIARVKTAVRVLDDPLAKELLADLEEMRSMVRAGLEEISRRKSSQNKKEITEQDVKTANPFGGFGL